MKLDSLAGVLKGGKEGKVLIAGDSAKSPLVLRVAHLSKDDDDWMPPLHNRAQHRAAHAGTNRFDPRVD